jgi:hypothetical protein
MSNKKQKIEEVNLTLIKPYWRNPRDNSKAIDVVRESIQRYGFNVPLVLDKNHVIITGHSRFKALLQLKYEKALCIISDMDEQKAKEYRIADNKTSEFAKWENNYLEQEMREIKELDDFQIFFPDVDLSLFLEDSVGQNVVPVSEVQIHHKEEALRSQFENDREDAVIEILCPHCGEPIFMDKGELKDKLM